MGAWASRVARPIYRKWYAAAELYDAESTYAREQLDTLRSALASNKTVFLAGIGVSGHNSGVSLVEVSAERGPRLLWNDEEERFTGIKHCPDFPEQTLTLFRDRLRDVGITAGDVHVWLASWDYLSMIAAGWRSFFEQFPTSLPLLFEDNLPKWRFSTNEVIARQAPQRIAEILGLDAPQPLVGMPHHENHASFSYAVSPFNHSPDPVLVTVLDGFGDDSAISVFLGREGSLTRIYRNASLADSLGIFYSIISSTQGGWTTLSSEGRYMGAAAWGDRDRLTNPFYKRLRDVFFFGPEGKVQVNRAMCNWQNAGERKPYARALEEAIGKPIPANKMWSPDHVLRIDDIEHQDATQRRVDLAAATQLVFEDALFHIVEHFIRSTGSDRLVMTGGTALNGPAAMQLLENFDRDWYRRHLGKDTRLHLWIPPTPGDAGVAMGAAYSFALRAGAKPKDVLQHAFYCGRAATRTEILRAVEREERVGSRSLGNVTEAGRRRAVADLLAFIVAKGGIVALYQGRAETGPRALGHRSILANPCNPRMLENINRQVKFREAIRPLAPMVTPEQAPLFFELSEGAADDGYNAYNYMVLTVRVRAEARARIPAVVHRDGTARIQIVRSEHDPFTYEFLKAMGRRAGVEVAVNTSFNVGSPIVQTPEQALVALRKARALTGLILISAEGDAFMTWDKSNVLPKDGGALLLRFMEDWGRSQPA